MKLPGTICRSLTSEISPFLAYSALIFVKASSAAAPPSDAITFALTPFSKADLTQLSLF